MMNSTSLPDTAPTILVVEVHEPLREDVSRTLKQVDYEVVLAGTGEEALDLISAADFDGLYCEVRLPGEVDGWEIGTTFSFIWPHKPTVYASASVSGPRVGCGMAFSTQALRPGAARQGVRDQRNCRASKAGAGMIASEAKISTSARIKLTSSFVHLT